MKQILFITTLLFFSNSVHAIQPIYVGVDYFKADVNFDGEKTHPSMSTIRLGMDIWKQIAIEAQYSQSNKSDNLFRFEVDIEESQALFVRFISREYNDITMDVSLGYASTKLTVDGPIGTFSGTDTYNGFAWGIAAHQTLKSLPNTSIRIAYQSLYDDGSLHIRGFSIGFSYYFK